MRRIALILVMCAAGFTGCAHHQLRFNTVKQAHTVADVQTQQVLDNLAKFAHNPGALPHFSYPEGGSSQVTDTVQGTSGFNFTPQALAGWMFGVNGSRGMQEAYTMVPLNDPRKLELMRCAYQKAVASCCHTGPSASCPDCEKRFNRFYLGSASPSLAQQKTGEGYPIYQVFHDGGQREGMLAYSVVDELGATQYLDLNTGERLSADVYEFRAVLTEDPLAAHTTSTGKVTTECLDGCCWFKVTNGVHGIPSTCTMTGHYCGTHVYVPECHRDKLARLTLVILDIAKNDPASLNTKEVVAYLDKFGVITEKSGAAYEVKATIGLTSSVDAVAARNKKNANVAKALKDFSEAISNDPKLKNKRLEDLDALAKELASDDSNKNKSAVAARNYLRVVEDASLEDAANNAADNAQERQRAAAQREGVKYLAPQSSRNPFDSNLLLLDQKLRTLTPNQ